VRAALERLQVAQRVVAQQHDRSPAAAVAAVGPAVGHVRLPAEGQAAAATGPALHEYARLVVEHLPVRMPGMSDSRVFLITGASTGIGAATARHAVEAGYKVVLAARSEDKLRALAGELGGDDVALAVACDVTDFAQQDAVVAAALERWGRLDVAFANAGFGAARGFLEETPEHWREMVLTNVLGAAFTIRATLPALKDTKGHLLLTGSVAGRRAIPGSLYSSTKWAVTGMGESVRQELNGTGVRTTLIEPGMVDTPFFDNPGEGRLEADDIARAVLYAVSQPAHVDVNELLIRPTAQDG
jgi:NADP-dependent 3-hydroxy acid dehydrogenase YdfG